MSLFLFHRNFLSLSFQCMQIGSLEGTLMNGNHSDDSALDENPANNDPDGMVLNQHFPTDGNDVILLDEYLKQKSTNDNTAVACK